MTLRNRILSYVRTNPGETATLIARALGAKLASVASALHKFVDEGDMTRKVGGVRGGYVYFSRTDMSQQPTSATARKTTPRL